MDLAVSLLQHYGYFVLLPLAIIEGPIITLVAGFFVTQGFFNPLAVYIIAIVGDFIGDSVLFLLGRKSKHALLCRIGSRFGVTSEKMAQAESFFGQHGRKAVALSKVTHGIGMTGLIAAGSLGIPYGRFIKTCVAVASVQVAVFLGLGVLFGQAYLQFQKYMDFFAATTIVVGVMVAAGLAIKSAKVLYR